MKLSLINLTVFIILVTEDVSDAKVILNKKLNSSEDGHTPNLMIKFNFGETNSSLGVDGRDKGFLGFGALSNLLLLNNKKNDQLHGHGKQGGQAILDGKSSVHSKSTQGGQHIGLGGVSSLNIVKGGTSSVKFGGEGRQDEKEERVMTDVKIGEELGAHETGKLVVNNSAKGGPDVLFEPNSKHSIQGTRGNEVIKINLGGEQSTLNINKKGTSNVKLNERGIIDGQVISGRKNCSQLAVQGGTSTVVEHGGQDKQAFLIGQDRGHSSQDMQGVVMGGLTSGLNIIKDGISSIIHVSGGNKKGIQGGQIITGVANSSQFGGLSGTDKEIVSHGMLGGKSVLVGQSVGDSSQNIHGENGLYGVISGVHIVTEGTSSVHVTGENIHDADGISGTTDGVHTVTEGTPSAHVTGRGIHKGNGVSSGPIIAKEGASSVHIIGGNIHDGNGLHSITSRPIIVEETKPSVKVTGGGILKGNVVSSRPSIAKEGVSSVHIVGENIHDGNGLHSVTSRPIIVEGTIPSVRVTEEGKHKGNVVSSRPIIVEETKPSVSVTGGSKHSILQGAPSDLDIVKKGTSSVQINGGNRPSAKDGQGMLLGHIGSQLGIQDKTSTDEKHDSQSGQDVGHSNQVKLGVHDIVGVPKLSFVKEGISSILLNGQSEQGVPGGQIDSQLGMDGQPNRLDMYVNENDVPSAPTYGQDILILRVGKPVEQFFKLGEKVSRFRQDGEEISQNGENGLGGQGVLLVEEGFYGPNTQLVLDESVQGGVGKKSIQTEAGEQALLRERQLSNPLGRLLGGSFYIDVPELEELIG